MRFINTTQNNTIELFQLDWFVDESGDTRFRGDFRDRGIWMACYQYDRDVAVDLADFPGEICARHQRHGLVGNNDIERVRIHEEVCQCIRCRTKGYNIIIFFLEELLIKIHDIRFIVDENNVEGWTRYCIRCIRFRCTCSRPIPSSFALARNRRASFTSRSRRSASARD